LGEEPQIAVNGACLYSGLASRLLELFNSGSRKMIETGMLTEERDQVFL
jgi:hypothetical protein